MLRKKRGDKSKEHLVAGLKGLGFGVLGGLTSVVSETYDGVSNDGIGGFFTGLGWGLIGTISKPAIGVLDLATGAATAVKESSRSTLKKLPPRLRPPRVVLGPVSSMPGYDLKEAIGQEKLYRFNGHNYDEIFVAYESLQSDTIEDLQILISSERILVFSCTRNKEKLENISSTKLVLSVYHGELNGARFVTCGDTEIRHYIELTLNNGKRPQIRCDNENVARTVSLKINYAKNMFEELKQALKEECNNYCDNI